MKEKSLLERAKTMTRVEIEDDCNAGPMILLQLVQHGDMDVVDAYYEWAVANGYIIKTED
jgi:hypothetical protein